MKETEQEKETYSWVMRIEGFIDIVQKSEKMPACHSIKKEIYKAIDSVIDRYNINNEQYRLYDYTDNVSEQEDCIGFEPEEEE